MTLGMIGLGRMGANMTERLVPVAIAWSAMLGNRRRASGSRPKAPNPPLRWRRWWRRWRPRARCG